MEDEDVRVLASCWEIHFSEKEGKLQKTEEPARRGLAPSLEVFPKRLPGP